MRDRIHVKYLTTTAAVTLLSGTAFGMGGHIGRDDWLAELLKYVEGSGTIVFNDVNEHKFDAICGIRHNIHTPVFYGSGVYIGEDSNGDHWILAAEHSIGNIDLDVESISAYFIRHPDGSIGNNDTSSENDWSTHYKLRIVEVIVPDPFVDTVLARLDLAGDPTAMDHIDPIPVWPTLPRANLGDVTPAETAVGFGSAENEWDGMLVGWGCETGCCQNTCMGAHRLRYGPVTHRGVETPADIDGIRSPLFVHINGVTNTEHDSGSPVLFYNEDGELGASATAVGGPPMPYYNLRRRSGFPIILNQNQSYWALDVTGNIGSDSSTDWVTSTGSTDPLLADGVLDMNDAIYVRARTGAGDIRFDIKSDSVINLDDWGKYVDELFLQNNKYGNWPTYPLRADMSDINGDGRLNEADAAHLRSLVAAGTAPLTADFDQSGSVQEADAMILDDVIAEFGHGVLADLDNDGDTDAADMILIRAHDSGSPFLSQAYPDTEYLLALDYNTDGLNNLYDALEFRREKYPGEIGSLTVADGYTSGPLLSFLPNWEVTIDDLRMLLMSVPLPTASGRGGDIMDVSSSSDPMDPGYAVPDGIVSMEDLWRILVHIQTPIAGETGPTDRLFAAPFDPNNDGRFNWHDLIDYYSHYATSDMAYINNNDVNGDGSISFADVNLLSVVLGSPQNRWKLFDEAGTGNPGLQYNHGVAGDYDGDCDGIYLSGSCCIDYGSGIIVCGACDATNNLAAVVVDTAADCDDRDAIIAAITASDFDFDGRRAGEVGYLFVMDYDLDGDNDEDDRVWIYNRIEPGDVNGDGAVCPTDFTAWIAAYNSGSLLGDVNRDGYVMPNDLNAWYAEYNSPRCTNSCNN